MIATLFVDLQNDFVNGTLPVPGGAEVCTECGMYAVRHKKDRFIIASQDWHLDPGDHWDPEHGGYEHHCAQDSWGARFNPAFMSTGYPLVQSVIRKGAHDAAPSPFDGRDVESGQTLEDLLRLRGITVLEVGGLATDVCVLAGVLDAVKLGFEVHVLAGLTAAIGGPQGKTNAIRQMIDAGAFIG